MNTGGEAGTTTVEGFDPDEYLAKASILIPTNICGATRRKPEIVRYGAPLTEDQRRG
jgi:hypothetical protein